MKGTIRKRGDSYQWQHPYTSNGKRRYKTGTEKRKGDAQKALTASLAAHAKGEQLDPSKMTVAEHLRGWLEVKKLAVKPGTWRTYHDIVEHRLIPTLGNEKLSTLAPPAIARAYSELRISGRRDGRPLSATSLAHTHRTLRLALEAAVEDRLIARNPADALKKDEKPKRRQAEMNVYTAQQLRAFLDSTSSHRLHPLFFLAATSAARRGELLALKWADIDLDAGQLSIRRSRVVVGYTVHEGTPKNGKARTVSLDPETVSVLRRWRRRQREERLAWGEGYCDSDYVFTAEDGQPVHPGVIADAFGRAVRRSGQPVLNFHGLRHTWATLALAAGTNPKVVQERLGHHSAALTLDLYSHVLPGMQAEAAATVAGLVFGGQR
jgi:integrase